MATIPIALQPDPGERGLVSREVTETVTRSLLAWDLFIEAAEQADLVGPSRSRRKRGLDIVLPLGVWPETRSLADVLDDAAAERYDDPVDLEAAEARTLAARGSVSPEEAIAGLRRARDELAAFAQSAGALEAFGQVTSSPLGPLPVLTLLHAVAYQLAVSALDLVPCGATPSSDLLDAGVVALVDTTGALAQRQGISGSITAMIPSGAWGFGSTSHDWRTAPVDVPEPADGPPPGPAVRATAEILLDITSGRVGNVAALWSQGDLVTHDLGGLMAFAPVVDQVPGIPGGTALRAASRTIGGVGRILGSLGRLPRLPGL